MWKIHQMDCKTTNEPNLSHIKKTSVNIFSELQSIQQKENGKTPNIIEYIHLTVHKTNIIRMNIEV